LLILALGFVPADALAVKIKDTIVRIAILKSADTFVLKTRGTFKITDLKTHQVIQEGRVFPATKIKAEEDAIVIGKESFPARKIRFASSKDIIVKVDKKNRKYRGDIDIVINSAEKLIVINRIGLEDYIRGILYHEVSAKWPMEAMKAQAVAARTYALYRMKENKDQAYDVTSDIYSQVYGGKSSEKYRTNLAVKRTKNIIMTYQGDILPAYFHAHCGGHTENAANVWKHESILPLSGKICDFCYRAPHYYWEKNLRLKDIQDKLNEKGYALGLIKDISVVERNKSGRIVNLKITERNGRETIIKGKDFRNMIGPNIIKSNLYSITMKGYYCDFIGRGWGHGVGMCQWGARQMALSRFKYDDILRYYYPGVSLVEYDDVKDQWDVKGE